MRILPLILIIFLAGCNCDDCCPICPPNEVCEPCPTTNCIEPIPTEDCCIANVVLGTSRKEVNERCGEGDLVMVNNNIAIYKYNTNETGCREFIFTDNELTYDTETPTNEITQ